MEEPYGNSGVFGNNNKKFAIAGIVGVVVILLIIGVYFFFPNLFFDVGNKITNPSLSGKIYITVLTYDENDDRRIDVLTYDLEEQGYRSLIPNTNRNMTAFVSSDKSIIAFASKVSGEGTFAQLFTMRVGEKPKQITNSDIFWKIHPQFSPDDKTIAYMGQKDLLAGQLLPDNWETYITDLEGNEQFIINGAYPQFSPDGNSLIVLKNNGLNLVDISTGSSEVVWSIEEGNAFTTMPVSLSKDKNRLAWSNPYDGLLYIFSIKSWSPFVIERESVKEITALYTVFSPNGKFLAIQKVDWDKDKHEPSNTRIVIYKIKSSILKKGKKVLDLDNIRLQKSIIITDWR